MRGGLQRQEAIASLLVGAEMGLQYAPSREHRRDAIAGLLADCGAIIRQWHVSGIFTDPLDESATDFADLMTRLRWNDSPAWHARPVTAERHAHSNSSRRRCRRRHPANRGGKSAAMRLTCDKQV